MKDCLDILVIDDEVDRMNVQHLLDKEGVKAVVHEASDCKSGIEKMKSREIDCVLIDYRLPDANGVEVLEKLTEVNRNNVPLILLTGMGGELLVAEGMKKGASDYLPKKGLDGKTLAHSIRNSIQVGSFEKKVPAVENALAAGPLAGKRILVTSGTTHEPIDPVRYIANRSSGAQGTAIARSLAALGAEVVFVTGPADVPPPEGVQVVRVQSARDMAEAVAAALPVDAAVMAAAVADWRVKTASGSKIKKVAGALPTLEFEENPDILATVSKLEAGRPGLVVGFAAETDDVIDHATAKRERKGCDWIVANDVSPETGIMGGSENAVTLISAEGAETWPRMGKQDVANRLAHKVAKALG